MAEFLNSDAIARTAKLLGQANQNDGSWPHWESSIMIPRNTGWWMRVLTSASRFIC